MNPSKRLILRATICTLSLFAVLHYTLTASASNNVSVQIICKIGVGVPNARIILYRVEANGNTSAVRDGRTDKNGRMDAKNLKPGSYELRVICSGGNVFTHKLSFGGAVDESHAYVFRCCPPAPGAPPSGDDGLISIDGQLQGTASATGAIQGKVVTANGLKKAILNTIHGQVVVNLPDDMKAGDTISGTVVTEPKGKTDEEKAKNRTLLDDYVIDLAGTRVPVKQPSFTWTPTAPQANAQARYELRMFDVAHGSEVPLVEVELRLVEATTEAGRIIGGEFPGPPSRPTHPDFLWWPVGQQGHPKEIYGPFDGYFSTTVITIGGEEVKKLAESPRTCVFESPTNITGPTEIVLREGNVETKGTYRNVGVRLSAPKTTLQRGERTTITVRVEGLQGIKEDVPLELVKDGVVNMEGGDSQTRSIKPTEVQPDGSFMMTRTITGEQTGAFNVTATIVMKGHESVAVGEQNAPLPIVEDYQPRLKPGEIWLGVPIDKVLGLQGDFVTIPIKVAAGPDTRKEITLSVDLMKRSNQNLDVSDFRVGPDPPIHWIDGYTADASPRLGPSSGASHLGMHSTRINYGVPLTKFMRLRIPPNAAEGVYLLKVTLTEHGSDKALQTGYVRLAIAGSIQWGDIPVRRQDDKIVVEIRDREGNPRTATTAYLRGSLGDEETIVLLKPTGDGKAEHVAKMPNVRTDRYKWTLVIENCGLPRYEKPVTFPRSSSAASPGTSAQEKLKKLLDTDENGEVTTDEAWGGVSGTNDDGNNTRLTEDELAHLLRKAGVPADDARREAKRLMQDFDGSTDDGSGEGAKGDGMNDVELRNAANNKNSVHK